MSKINDIDMEIKVLERLLANANERRREEVNRTDANKTGFVRGVSPVVRSYQRKAACDHIWGRMIQDQHFTCGICGAKKPL